jgi:hypothetical protein
MVYGEDAFRHAFEDCGAAVGFHAEPVDEIADTGGHAMEGLIEDRGFLTFVGQWSVEIVGVQDVLGERAEAFDAPGERTDEDPCHNRTATEREEDFEDNAVKAIASAREIDGDDNDGEERETAQEKAEPDRRGHTGND